MYKLPYFHEQDPAVVLDFMRRFPFAMLTGCSGNRTVATQVPLMIEERDEKIFLSGHIMRQTDHHSTFEKNGEVLVVFTSPHTYVSASWYENPHQGSTWNYISVHARGTLRFLDAAGLVDVLKKTTLHFENYNAQSPTVFENLPEEYTSRLMKAIIAFEIEVREIDNVWKVSQNRDEKSFHTIMNKLGSQSPEGKFIAEEMQRVAPDVFKGVSK